MHLSSSAWWGLSAAVVVNFLSSAAYRPAARASAARAATIPQIVRMSVPPTQSVPAVATGREKGPPSWAATLVPLAALQATGYNRIVCRPYRRRQPLPGDCDE